ncbi:MAG: nucleotide exchange factor GrpE [Oscillospiraceae bacterium]|nr:nucleotide exchange factor GrpE [Oscillospiraceae bacterium]
MAKTNSTSKTDSTSKDKKEKTEKKNLENKNTKTEDKNTKAEEDKKTEEIVNEIEIDPNSPEALQNELAAERDKYLRLAAEYDNYRKRSAKEREMIYTDARTNSIAKLLPVYDNLERALKMECSDEAYYKGIEMIMTQLTETLNEMNVREIPAVGEPFDPNLHNAVMTIKDPTLGDNIVAEEYQKGFILGDRVIRFSTVVVAN